jgi:hypothetical protein
LAAHRAGLRNFQDYIILGDDVTIADELVGKEYVKIITSIGVEISSAKRVIPTPGYNSVEFASKLIVNGDNLSPLPIGLLLQEDIQRFLYLLISTLDSIAGLHVSEPFHRLLEAIAPEDLSPLSRSFIVGSLGLKSSGDMRLETILVLLGIALGTEAAKAATGPKGKLDVTALEAELKLLATFGETLSLYLDRFSMVT